MLTQLALPTQELQEVLQPTCFCIKLLNTVPFNVKWILTELPHCVRRFDDLMSKSLENCLASLSWTGTLLRMRLIPVISPSSWFTVAVALFFFFLAFYRGWQTTFWCITATNWYGVWLMNQIYVY